MMSSDSLNTNSNNLAVKTNDIKRSLESISMYSSRNGEVSNLISDYLAKVKDNAMKVDSTGQKNVENIEEIGKLIDFFQVGEPSIDLF